MAQSINTRVDVVVEATSYQGLTNYGKIMVGDKGFEFLNQILLEIPDSRFTAEIIYTKMNNQYN